MTFTCCRCQTVFLGTSTQALDLGWVGRGLIEPGRTWCPKETAQQIADDIQRAAPVKAAKR